MQQQEQTEHSKPPRRGSGKKTIIMIVVGAILLVFASIFVNFLHTALTITPAVVIVALIASFAYMVILGVGIGFVVLVILVVFRNREGAGSTHGSAHFAEPQEMPMTTSQQEKESPLILGYSQHGLVALDEERQKGHVLLIAPTKKGKTTGIIIPGLLHEQGNRSLVINDTKHELIDLCYGAITQHHTGYIFSPTRPSESDRYNPLVHVSTMSDARDVAQAIVKNTGDSQDRFWDDSATLLLTSAILHLRAAHPDAPFSAISELLTRNLSDVSQILTQSPSPQAQRAAKAFMANVGRNERLEGSIMTDVATRLFNTWDEETEQVTATDDFDFQKLADEPSAVFIHIPPSQASRLKWLSSCFLMQLINYLLKQQHKLKFAFYLDELANAGYIPKYLEYISYIRTEAAFIQAIQDFGQLERVYGEAGKDTILANSGTKIFFSGIGLLEAEYASRLMGQTTVLARTENSDNTSYAEVGRPLMFPDEIRTMPANFLAVIMDNLPPFLIRNIRYYQDSWSVRSRVRLPYSRMQRPPVAPFTLPEPPAALKPPIQQNPP